MADTFTELTTAVTVALIATSAAWVGVQPVNVVAVLPVQVTFGMAGPAVGVTVSAAGILNDAGSAPLMGKEVHAAA